MINNDELSIILAAPRGFCAGVTRAIEIVERALQKYGAPIYVRHEIVHNKRVIETLKSKGAIFVSDIAEIPNGAITIFSAHGVSKVLEDEADKKSLSVIDATCPLVTKVHISGKKHANNGHKVIVIGHEGHPEVEGTVGQIDGDVYVVSEVADINKLPIDDNEKVAYVTQTTLSMDDTKEIIEALKNKFINLTGPDLRDICYATQNRQSAVHELCKHVDALLVLGAKNSSNSNRLKEIACSYGIKGWLIDDASQLNSEMISNIKTLGISAGASAPDILVEELLEALAKIRKVKVTELEGKKENVVFQLPEVLQDDDLVVFSSLLPKRLTK